MFEGSSVASVESPVMARQRFIWPEIWKDPTFGKLTPEEQIMFVGLFSIADDEGRTVADPLYLRGELFTYKEFTAEQVRTLRDSVAVKMASVQLYRIGTVEYITLLKWSEYQTPKYPKPSKIPPPPDVETSASNTGSDVGEQPETLNSPGWVGLGREGMGRVLTIPTPEKGSADVLRVYEHWRLKRNRTRANYAKVSPKRADKIKARLREFSADDLCTAIDCIDHDPWADRHLHDDIPLIFRSREQVERFLDLPGKLAENATPNGAVPAGDWEAKMRERDAEARAV